MNKIITMAILTALLLTGISVARAEDGKKDIGSPIPMMGTITQITNDKITIKAAFVEFISATINIDAETKYFDVTEKPKEGEKREPKEITKADIKVGDKINCRGIVRVEEGKEAIFLAKAVAKVSEFHMPKPPPGDDRKRDEPPQFIGVFKSVNGNILTVTNPEGTEDFKVMVGDETKYTRIQKGEEGKPKRTELALSDLKPGDKLVIVGKPDRKEGEEKPMLKAFIVMVVDEFPPPPKDAKDKIPHIIGVLKSIDGNKLTLTDPEGKKEFKVITDEKTKFFKVGKGEDKPERKELALSDLKLGDKLIIIGKPEKKEGEEKPVLKAIVVTVVDDFLPPPPPPGEEHRKPKLLGTVKSINDGIITVTLFKMEDMKEAQLKYDEKTKYITFQKPGEEGKKPEKVDKKLEDLKPGQKVMIEFAPEGKPEGGIIKGRACLVVFMDEFPPDFAFGEVTEISSTKITIKTPEMGDRPSQTVSAKLTTETRVFQLQRGEKPKEIAISEIKVGDKVEMEHKDGNALVVRKPVMKEK
jgi:hypothetical protein